MNKKLDVMIDDDGEIVNDESWVYEKFWILAGDI